MQDYTNVVNQAYKAYSPDMIQRYYDMAMGNMNRQAANTGSFIGRQAGAHATNMLNPSGFILGHITQSQAPYAEQRGNLAAQSAQAQQQGAAGLANLLFQIKRAQAGDELAWEQLNQQKPGFMDYLMGGLQTAGTFAGTPTGSKLLFG